MKEAAVGGLGEVALARLMPNGLNCAELDDRVVGFYGTSTCSVPPQVFTAPLLVRLPVICNIGEAPK